MNQIAKAVVVVDQDQREAVYINGLYQEHYEDYPIEVRDLVEILEEAELHDVPVLLDFWAVVLDDTDEDISDFPEHLEDLITKRVFDQRLDESK